MRAADTHLRARGEQLVRDFEQTIAQHLTDHGEDPLHAALIAGAIIGALTAALRHARQHPGPNRDTLIDATIARIRGERSTW